MENQVYMSPQQIVLGGKYPFTIGQLRHLLLYRHRNGLDGAVRKIGKRLYLKKDIFDQWIESQSAKGGRV
jgi:hypothetical protein